MFTIYSGEPVGSSLLLRRFVFRMAEASEKRVTGDDPQERRLGTRLGRFTVWVNRNENSGLVNFVPQSRLPFVQINSNYRKTAAND